MSSAFHTMPGKSIRLFLVDGSPGGLLTAEIPNWTGHVLAGLRSRLADLLKRPESRRPGLYLLLGQQPDTGQPLAYNGESETLDERLAQHARPEEQRGRGFWDRVVLITSKDANGRKSWRVVGTGQTYADWQSQQVEASLVEHLGELPITERSSTTD